MAHDNITPLVAETTRHSRLAKLNNHAILQRRTLQARITLHGLVKMIMHDTIHAAHDRCRHAVNTTVSFLAASDLVQAIRDRVSAVASRHDYRHVGLDVREVVHLSI